MYRISFEVIVHDPDDAMRVQNEIQRMNVHVEKYNMEFINDGVQHHHVHTMDGNVMAVPDPHYAAVPDRPHYDIEEYARGHVGGINDDQLRKLLSEARSTARAIREPEPEEPEDFLEEKDMEL